MKTDIKKSIAQLAKSGWKGSHKKLVKDFEYQNFEDAFAFMTRCALEIEKLDHHPEWTNVYNKMHVELTTHDTGGVTEKDVALAKIMDKVASMFPLKGRK